MPVPVKQPIQICYCLFTQNSKTWGFLLMQGPTLDAHRHPMASCYAPWCITELMPKLIGSKAKQCLKTTKNTFYWGLARWMSQNPLCIHLGQWMILSSTQTDWMEKWILLENTMWKLLLYLSTEGWCRGCKTLCWCPCQHNHQLFGNPIFLW